MTPTGSPGPGIDGFRDGDFEKDDREPTVRGERLLLQQEGDQPGSVIQGERARRRPERVSAVIVLLGLFATALGVALALRTDRSNEERLLRVQTDQAATVLAAATTSFQEPLASALDVAASVLPRRRRAVFQERFARNVGDGKLFQVGALWRRTPGGLIQIATVGGQPILLPPSAAAERLARRAMSARTMAVAWTVVDGQIRITFALADPDSGFVLYAERTLPADRRAPVDSDSAFASLNYAIYLGDSTRAEDLAMTDVALSDLPLEGPTYSTTVPFGDDVLTLATRPRDHLGSDLGWQLPWLIGLGGPLVTVAALVLARQLLRSRERAESDTATITSLYRRVERLYGEQHELSVRLQKALLPRTLPAIPGFDVAATYVAGAQGIDIGGDWYSVVTFGDEKFAFVIGDVSGHGIDAVAEMARARFTIRAYLSDGDSPQAALEKCSRQFDITADGHMVTVLAGVGNWRTGDLTIASAGHPAPLLVEADGVSDFVNVRPAPPLGAGVAEFEATTVTLRPGSTLLCYTDGLIERRTEAIDAGFSRLARVAAALYPTASTLDHLLDALLNDMRDADRHDDIAVLAIRRNLHIAPSTRSVEPERIP